MPRNYGQKSRYQRKKMPHARKPLDDKQNKAIDNLKKEVKAIKGDIELKYKDTQIALANIQPAVQSQLLNGIPALVTAQTDRIGARIRLTSVQFRIKMQNQATQLSGVSLRIIVFSDKQANASTSALSGDALTPGGQALLQSGLTANPILMPYQHESSPRFQIHFDKVYTWNPNTEATYTAAATVSYLPQDRVLKKKIKINHMVQYADDGNGIAAIVKNSLWMYVCSDVATAPTLGPSISGVARVYFKDA